MNDYYNVRSFGATGNGVTDDTNDIKAAIAALATLGGTVYFPPGTYLVTDTLAWGDKDITFNFSSGAKIITTGLGAKPLFKCNTGLTAPRKAIFWNPECVGENSAAAQYFLELADINARCKPEIYSPDITGFRRVFNISGADVTYTTIAIVKVTGGRIIPPDAASVLITCPSPAGTYDAPREIFFSQCRLWDDSSGVLGWVLDFDGDLLLSQSQIAVLGASKVNGLVTVEANIGGGAGASLEVFGGSYDGYDTISAGLSAITLKLTVAYGKLIGCLLGSNAAIIVNGSGVAISGLVQYIASPAAIAVDILAGANGVTVEGSFQDCATAAIRTAATKGSFRGTFKPTGAHKAIIELAGANFNIASGCSGLGVAAGNVTIVGAGSLYDVTLANTV